MFKLLFTTALLVWLPLCVNSSDIVDNNLKLIKEHNAQKNVAYTLSETSPFLHLSWEEFQKTILMQPQECSATMTGRLSLLPLSDKSLIPSHFDWRDQNVVTHVKDQGQCGSCYAFSSTGAIESHYNIQTGRTVKNETTVSEQQIIDCALDFDNHGCDGGLPSHVFEYVHYAGGIDTEESYPYFAHPSGQCSFNPKSAPVRTARSFNITEGDEDTILQLVATVGPVSVAYQVVDDFMFYQGGVYSSSECKSGVMDVNHAVLIVGYGYDPVEGAYWIVKNSWGHHWGEKGYFRIARGFNMCGIAVCASYPILDVSEGDLGTEALLPQIETF